MRFGTSTLSTAMKCLRKKEYAVKDESGNHFTTPNDPLENPAKMEMYNAHEMTNREYKNAMDVELCQAPKVRRKRSRTKAKTQPPEKKQKTKKAESPVELFPEMLRLRDTIHRAKKLRITAKKGIKEQWGPSSKNVERFLESCKDLEHVEIPEVTQLKTQVQLYCTCRSLYQEGVFMIGCDKCGEWYHPKCIEMSEAEAQQREEFVCKACMH